jgi:hypothetical protein
MTEGDRSFCSLSQKWLSREQSNLAGPETHAKSILPIFLRFLEASDQPYHEFRYSV